MEDIERFEKKRRCCGKEEEMKAGGMVITVEEGTGANRLEQREQTRTKEGTLLLY